MVKSDTSPALKFIAFLAIIATAYVVFFRPRNIGERTISEDAGPFVSAEEFKQAITSNPVTLVKFGATWCGPCRYMDDELEKLKEKNFAASVLHIDVDNNPDLSSEYDVSGIPKTILFKNGVAVDTQVGGMSAEQIEEWVNSK
ncbi:thioredoxin family protein [Pirellulaceae bacterium SH449]